MQIFGLSIRTMYSRMCGKSLPKFLLFLGFFNVYLIWKLHIQNHHDHEKNASDLKSMHYTGTSFVKGEFFPQILNI